MKKSLKRALALLLACTIVIGSVYNTRQKAYASASAIIAGGGATAVGVEVAFPYLLAITGVVAAGAAVYENRDKIKEWGSAQFGKFKKWVNDNLDEWGWYADAAVAGTAIAKWGDKLGKGTLDKSDPTWSAYKKWVEDDVCSESSDVGTLNGYPTLEKNEPYVFGSTGSYVYCKSGTYQVFTFESPGGVQPGIIVFNDVYSHYIRHIITDKGHTSETGASYSMYRYKYNGVTYYYDFFQGLEDRYKVDSLANYLGDWTTYGTWNEFVAYVCGLYVNGLPVSGNNEKEYTYVGGLAPSLGGAGVLEGDWDVVGVGEKEDEKETKLPWVGSPDLDHTISDVVSGEKTWTDVLDQVGVGVIDRTEEGSKVIDEDGVTTKDWVYADSTTTVPDITIPNEGEVSKELKNYTFAGLEKIFPFCLPFDMIDFIKVLDATPQAPHFKYAFPYPTTSGMKTFEIDIDLSPFDSVAELLRDMECLLFIMGLILVTRSRMIRG